MVVLLATLSTGCSLRKIAAVNRFGDAIAGGGSTFAQTTIRSWSAERFRSV